MFISGFSLRMAHSKETRWGHHSQREGQCKQTATLYEDADDVSKEFLLDYRSSARSIQLKHEGAASGWAFRMAHIVAALHRDDG